MRPTVSPTLQEEPGTSRDLGAVKMDTGIDEDDDRLRGKFSPSHPVPLIH